MDVDPIVLSIPIYFLLISVELIVQLVQKRKLYRLNDAVTNISCGITQQITNLFFKVGAVAAYQLVYEHLALFQIPVTWYTVAILFVLVDLCYYWAHRKSHEINLFWGGHVVHHQSEDYNFSVALRQGSFQILWTFMFYLPLAVLGFDTLTFVAVSAFVTLYQFWIHTETIGKLGWLEYILNTPSHHRVHHGRDPKYIDRNHAGVFIIWDRLFGTFQEEEERPTYGVTQPVNSWNPVWLNVKHYGYMWGLLRQSPKWKDRLNIVFNKPGWQPEHLGGYLKPQEVNKTTYQKYDAKGLASANLYVLFQFVLALIGTALFLFNAANFSLAEMVFSSLLIISTLVSLGALLENRTSAAPLEIVRMACAVVAILYFTEQTGFYGAILAFCVLYFFVSILWIFSFQPQHQKRTVQGAVLSGKVRV
uniref:Alkylglycerol monooxygenase n=1 Tax=Roseihalotalea indica TaxID=2867963 RepID=A0AA49GJ58_9BACT|nr:sterol desaturase family protein [Tunicatimonas sp. TK19036]